MSFEEWFKRNYHDLNNLPDEAIKEAWEYREEKTEWISVDKELPKDNQRVLTVDVTGRVYNTVKIKDGFKCVGLVWEHTSVTHWMKLPEPPSN